MNDLRELQALFATHLNQPRLDKESDFRDISPHLAVNHYSPHQVINIYRNNYIISLRQILEQLFPITSSLTGEEFFVQTCRQYILSQPLKQPHLDHFGGEFVDYLHTLDALIPMPFVAQMAALEWHLDRISHIYYQPTFDFNALSQVCEAEQMSLVFTLTDVSHLITSGKDLINLHHHLTQGSHALKPMQAYDAASYILILQNQQGQSALMEVNEKHWPWLIGIQQGLSLSQLCALPNTPLDELMAQITDWIALGCIDGFYLANPAIPTTEENP